MKLSKIGALCKTVKRFMIYRNHKGLQWISDGYAIFPLRDMPPLGADNVFTIFDVPEEKRGKMMFDEREEMPPGINLSDTSEGEVALKYAPLAIRYRGAVLLPYFAGSHVIFVDEKYLSCFGDGVELFARKSSENKYYVVVKKGFFIEGAMLPSEVSCAELADVLAEISESVAREIEPPELDRDDL